MPSAMEALVNSYLSADQAIRQKKDQEFERARIIADMEMRKILAQQQKEDRDRKFEADTADRSLREQQHNLNAQIRKDTLDATKENRAVDQYAKGASPEDAALMLPEELRDQYLPTWKKNAVPLKTQTSPPRQFELGDVPGLSQSMNIMQGVLGSMTGAPGVAAQGAMAGPLQQQMNQFDVNMPAQTQTRMVSPQYADTQQLKIAKDQRDQQNMLRLQDVEKRLVGADARKSKLDMAELAIAKAKDKRAQAQFSHTIDMDELKVQAENQRIGIAQANSAISARNATSREKEVAIKFLGDARAGANSEIEALTKRMNKYQEALPASKADLLGVESELRSLKTSGSDNPTLIDNIARLEGQAEKLRRQITDMQIAVGDPQLGLPSAMQKNIDELRKNLSMTVNPVGKPAPAASAGGSKPSGGSSAFSKLMNMAGSKKK